MWIDTSGWIMPEIFPTSAVQPSVGVFSPQDVDLIKYMLKLEGKNSGSQTYRKRFILILLLSSPLFPPPFLSSP